MSDKLGGVARVGVSFSADVRWLCDTVCVIILFPLLIPAGKQNDRSSPNLLRILLLVGSFSYVLSAMHTPVLRLGHSTAKMDPEQWDKLLVLPFFALARRAAVAVDLLYDRRVRERISERISKRQWPRMVASQGDALPEE